MSVISYKPSRAAVIDGQLIYTSPSALNRYVGCPRSWWFRYGPMHLEDKAGPAAELGDLIHRRIEWYLKTGEDLLGRHERHALTQGLIPAPGALGTYLNTVLDEYDNVIGERMLDILVEGKTAGLDLLGTPINGKIDLLDPRGGVAVLTDWKTSSSISDKAAAPASDLYSPDTEYGRQMLAYAEWYRRAHPDATHVILRHVYIQTRGSNVAELKTERVRLADVAESWQSIGEKYVRPMRQYARATRPEDVPANLGYCHKFHKPCAFITQCPRAKDFEDLFDFGGGMGLLDQFVAVAESSKAPLVPGAIPPPVEAVVEAPSAAPVEPVVAEEAPKKRGRKPKDEPVTPATAVASGFYLYFKGAPVGILTSTLHAYVEDLEAKVLSGLGEERLKDVRLSAHDMLCFGKWKAVLSETARRNPPPPGHYIVSSMAGEKIQVVADALVPLATQVVL